MTLPASRCTISWRRRIVCQRSSGGTAAGAPLQASKTELTSRVMDVAVPASPTNRCSSTRSTGADARGCRYRCTRASSSRMMVCTRWIAQDPSVAMSINVGGATAAVTCGGHTAAHF
jgi:hypothetical protein